MEEGYAIRSIENECSCGLMHSSKSSGFRFYRRGLSAAFLHLLAPPLVPPLEVRRGRHAGEEERQFSGLPEGCREQGEGGKERGQEWDGWSPSCTEVTHKSLCVNPRRGAMGTQRGEIESAPPP